MRLERIGGRRAPWSWRTPRSKTRAGRGPLRSSIRRCGAMGRVGRADRPRARGVPRARARGRRGGAPDARSSVPDRRARSTRSTRGPATGATRRSGSCRSRSPPPRRPISTPIHASLGAAYVQNGRGCRRTERRAAPEAWRRAFHDPEFVKRSLLPAAALVGAENALALVPDRAEPLRAAYDTLNGAGDLSRAIALRPRLDRALRVQREEELRHIASRREGGDLEGARSACQEWLRRSPAVRVRRPSGPGADGPAARALAQRHGRFLAHRSARRSRPLLSGTDASAMSPRRRSCERPMSLPPCRTPFAPASACSPATTRAPRKSVRRLRRRRPTNGCRILIEVARAKLAGGDAGGCAGRPEEPCPHRPLEGCDVLLIRRDVAIALGDTEEATEVEDRLRATCA